MSIDQTDPGDFVPAGSDGYPAKLGTIADRYVIDRVIGKGGMACVYLAHDRRMGRSVALKILQRGVNDSQSRRTRFAHEIEIMAAVSVEGVVDIYDRGEFGGWLWYAMPYIPGDNLAEYLRSNLPTVRQRVAMIARLAHALEGLHHAGISHRDLKPENIMIGPKGMPLLMDFGIAKYVDSERRIDLTDDGVTPGTPLYMAPERFRPDGKKENLQVADVFSLGLIAYEILTNTYPYGSKQVGLTEHVLRMGSTEVASVQSFEARIPATVAKAVERALAVDPIQRITAKELAQSVEAALHEMSSSGMAAVELSPTAGDTNAAKSPLSASSALIQVSKRSGVRPAILVGVIGVLLLLIGVVGYNLHSSKMAAKRPTLTIVAMVDGQTYDAAEILINGRSLGLKNPNRFDPKPGQTYTIDARYRNLGRLWRCPQVVRTADWQGEERLVMNLTEFHGPIDARDWYAADAGVQFTWIPPMGIWVGTHEVTNAQYRLFRPSHDSGEFRGLTLNDENQPAVNLSLESATAYATWLTERERAAGRLPVGRVYRLPTEEEWLTFASCGHDDWIYPWPGAGVVGNYWGAEASDDESPESVGNGGYNDGHKRTCDVTESGISNWWLYGVGGNASEICIATDAEPDESGTVFPAAARGGCYLYWSWTGMRLDFRFPLLADTATAHTGMRLVLAAPLAPAR